MNGLRGFLAGTVAVATAEVLLTAPGIADRIGGFGDFLAVVIDRVVNPDVPALGPVDFQGPPPATFGQSQPDQATKPSGKNYLGGVGSKPYGPPVPNHPRSKTLHSTKAKRPRPIPVPQLAPTPGRH